MKTMVKMRLKISMGDCEYEEVLDGEEGGRGDGRDGEKSEKKTRDAKANRNEGMEGARVKRYKSRWFQGVRPGDRKRRGYDVEAWQKKGVEIGKLRT